MLIKLLTRLLVIIFFAGIILFASAASEWKSNSDYADNLPLYAGAGKRVGDSSLKSKAKGYCNSGSVSGTFDLDAAAPGSPADPPPKAGNFNGNWSDSVTAEGHSNTAGAYGASSTVSGTHSNSGTSDTASANI